MLHVDVEKYAKDRGAMVISQELLAAIALRGARSAYQTLNGVSVPSNNPGVDIRILAISVDPQKMTAELDDTNNAMSLAIAQVFDLQLALHLAGNPAEMFSTINYRVKSLFFPLTATDNALILGEPQCDVTGAVALSPTRQHALAQPAAPNEKDVERVEGALAFILAHRIITSAFGSVPPLSLLHMFPHFTWSSSVDLAKIDEYLVIVPQDGKISTQTGCPPRHGLDDWEIQVSKGAAVPSGQNGYDVTIPVNVTQPPRRVGQGGAGDPMVALYLPQPVLDLKFKDLYPAVCFEDQGSGFLGFYTQACIAFEGIAVDVDVTRLGLVVTVKAKMWGRAEINIDVPCVGREPIAYTTKLQIGTTTASVFAGLEFDGRKLTLKSDVDRLDIGKIEIYVVMLSAWGGYLAGGWGALIGFVMDVVVDLVLQHNVEISLRHGLEDAVDSDNFDLIDLTKYLPYLPHAPNVPAFSGRKRSVLWGVGFNPGLHAQEVAPARRS